MVAGHPVAVHAPARYRPGALVRAPGLRRPTPGAGANVAVRSRVTKKSITSAPRARGSSRSSSGRYRSRSTATGASISFCATDWDSARYWPSSPEASVRSNTHCTGVPRAAKNGPASTLRS
ncbi:hypothetical protein STENM223S_05023 [Streptomyces tendae]